MDDTKLWKWKTPGFGIRVTDKGRRTFILFTRYPGSKNPTRRALGNYPTMGLEKARAKARSWRELLDAGRDPKEEEERKRRDELRKKADSFEAALNEYAKRVLTKQRRGRIVERELRSFFADWLDRPITSIHRRDVLDVIGEVLDRGAMYQAHSLLGSIRGLFNWVVDLEVYGLEVSPCDRIRPKRLIGERKPRQRVLNDAELRAFWRATQLTQYPFGPVCTENLNPDVVVMKSAKDRV